MGQGSSKDLVKTHKNAELENGPRMPKESKWAEDAQGERNGPKEKELAEAKGERNGLKEPTSNVIGQESPQ